MNPIVFLTVDNVINTQSGLEHWMKVKNDYHDNYGIMFCPKAVEALTKVINQFSADVVITCDWRSQLELKDFKAMLKDRGIKWNVIDYTPELGKSQEEEIKKWMDKNGHPSQFVIISDEFNEDETIFPDNYVKTQVSTGIAEKRLYRKAIAVLKRVKHVRQRKVEKPVAKSNPIF